MEGKVMMGLLPIALFSMAMLAVWIGLCILGSWLRLPWGGTGERCLTWGQNVTAMASFISGVLVLLGMVLLRIRYS